MAQAQTKSFRERAATSSASGRAAAARSNPDGRGMEMARHMGETFFDGFASMTRECLRFMSTRVQEDMKAAHTFAHCRHPSEFVEAELRFMQSLIHQYSENADRMLDIAARVVGHNLDDMEDRLSDAARRPNASPERSAA